MSKQTDQTEQNNTEAEVDDRPMLRAPDGETNVLLHSCCAPCAVDLTAQAQRHQGQDPVAPGWDDTQHSEDVHHDSTCFAFL